MKIEILKVVSVEVVSSMGVIANMVVKQPDGAPFITKKYFLSPEWEVNKDRGWYQTFGN